MNDDDTTRDSGLFDLSTILAEPRATFPPRWADIVPVDPFAAAREEPSGGVAPKRTAPLAASIVVAVSMLAAGALAWAPIGVPAKPMMLAATSTSAVPAAAAVHYTAAATRPAAMPEPTPVPEAPALEPVTSRRRVVGASAPTASPPTATPAHSWETGEVASNGSMDRSLDDLLDQAIGDTPADPRPTPSVALPATPTARQVSTTLRALEGEVGQCIDGPVTVRLTVDGPTGAVTGASVNGASGAQASCVTSVVRTARFPRFERTPFVITFPFAG